MASELIITKKEHHNLSVLVRDRKVIQMHAEPLCAQPDVIPKVGDIYVGKVRNIVKNINAAFVEFSKGQMGYLSLSDKILPIHAQECSNHKNRILVGDEIIVQIKREASKTKPPTLTGAVDITGRYAALTIGRTGCSVSKKVRDKARRDYLRSLLKEYESEQYSLIARTNCEDAPEELLKREIEQLLKRYQAVLEHGRHRTVFTRLETAPAGFLCDIRDGYAAEVERILTDDEELYTITKDYLQEQMPEELDKLILWDASQGSLNALYNIDRELEHALMPKVWLKSGAYLVIQPTEALVSIDVNTGKAISGKKEVQKTFYKVNLEAAREIAKQLRLRNLSGMILIDFIDMDAAEDNQSLMELLRQEVRKDPVQTTVVDMTKLGLVELTRKKVKKTLFEQMTENGGST